MTNAWGEETCQKVVKLFFFIPVYKYKQKSDRKVWKICGLPLFKIKRKGDGAVVKYYFCGLHFLTAKTKQG